MARYKIETSLDSTQQSVLIRDLTTSNEPTTTAVTPDTLQNDVDDFSSKEFMFDFIVFTFRGTLAATYSFGSILIYLHPSFYQAYRRSTYSYNDRGGLR